MIPQDAWYKKIQQFSGDRNIYNGIMTKQQEYEDPDSYYYSKPPENAMVGFSKYSFEQIK